jgi:alanine racemase
VDVDLDALLENARTVARLTGRPLLPMVKANGYGIGAAAAACALERLDPWGYGVATVGEGAELRRAGIRRPIVVFTPLLADAAPAYVAEGLRPVVAGAESLAAWRAVAGGRPFHLEIDTGMSRGGVRWDDAGGLDALVPLLDGTGWEGVFTHFHSADSEPASCAAQWSRFERVLARLARATPARPPLVHAANSAAAMEGERYAADLVRPGIFLYGVRCGDEAPKPVLAVRARIVALRRLCPGDTVGYGGTWRAERETTVATLAIGYADGLPRALSNRGMVAVRGRLVPIVGRVTMDMTMVALPDDLAGAVAPGEIATVLGGRVDPEAQAARAGTIPYELFTALGPRLPRRYALEGTDR